ncbi:DUF4054 domain-containing protein [Acinetobacter baumannii]|uniref:DUF4054 domain-containing protein n=1 Tax=Acinetobacter baumannii TaxID=470 RepID=UPI000F766D80|nr:DUF4054 domain-containing protein [Acinetobacter baumannii]RSQ40165.1 DUF4054 domain-containing protein [Acinetobacter baumannii]
MDVQTFREKFSTDSSLMSLPDAKIQDALEEADLIVSQIEFGALKERAVGLYAAHILKVGISSGNGAAFGTASSMTIAGQSEPYRVCRRVNILRDYPDDKTKLYPRN